MKKACVVALAAAVVATGAWADDGFAAADAKLNQQYHQIEGRLKQDQATHHKLLEAQRAWVVYRDAECRFAASMVEDGSVYPQVLSACKEDLTDKRNADFKRYLNCEEGDMSCPVPRQ